MPKRTNSLPPRFLIRRKTLGTAPCSSSYNSGTSWPKAYGGEGQDGDVSAEPPTLGRLSSCSGSDSRSSSLYLSCLSSGEGVKVRPARNMGYLKVFVFCLEKKTSVPTALRAPHARGSIRQ